MGLVRPSMSFQSRAHFCLRLLQVDPHSHLAVHRRRGGEVLLGLLALARAPIERAEAEMAVRNEGTHAPRLRQRQRLPVSVLGLLHIGRTRSSADGGHGEQRASLLTTRFLLSGQVERLERVLPSLVDASCTEIDGTQPSGERDLTASPASLESVPERLLQEYAALGEASHARVCLTQRPSDSR